MFCYNMLIVLTIFITGVIDNHALMGCWTYISKLYVRQFFLKFIRILEKYLHKNANNIAKN